MDAGVTKLMGDFLACNSLGKAIKRGVFNRKSHETTQGSWVVSVAIPWSVSFLTSRTLS